ncbi:Rrf2 family transcriptional regulator [Pontiella sp.]|uniref:RrF2 family transcriptional regulator n=1 Tax=Pontiella sp. TaxID=2837462 RepID=UPI00356548F5
MHLKQHTDYSLRILTYVARKCEAMVSAHEISEACGISYSHTVKVVNKLGKLGDLDLKRGRYGCGIQLAAEPETINLATVVEQFESQPKPHFPIDAHDSHGEGSLRFEANNTAVKRRHWNRIRRPAGCK